MANKRIVFANFLAGMTFASALADVSANPQLGLCIFRLGVAELRRTARAPVVVERR